MRSVGRVDRSKPPAAARAGLVQPAGATRLGADDWRPGRELVPLRPTPNQRSGGEELEQERAREPHLMLGGSRPSAPFLAQLIAIAQQAPQTRKRRRASPDQAGAAYTAAAAPGIRTGLILSRSS